MKTASTTPPGVRHTRRVVTAQARLKRGQEVWSCDILDLSLSGVRLSRPADFDASTGLPLQFELQVPSGAECRIECRVARLSRDEIALLFEHLGAEADSRLRDYIENSGRLLDPVDRE